ncbi:hypothetical protein COLO4_00146 [Corchorus olitorius]|uniref:Uncharacterized protein n=1 Tax=Corchorus olitorius TaxID=93759 RepID=A0A1R3L4J8_9ROSI|nr:hypothetical protein COLO4_00146 [Corchorus olitorius]
MQYPQFETQTPWYAASPTPPPQAPYAATLPPLQPLPEFSSQPPLPWWTAQDKVPLYTSYFEAARARLQPPPPTWPQAQFEGPPPRPHDLQQQSATGEPDQVQWGSAAAVPEIQLGSAPAVPEIQSGSAGAPQYPVQLQSAGPPPDQGILQKRSHHLRLYGG